MSKFIVFAAVLALLAGTLHADSFRMGIAVAAELAGDVTCENFFNHIMDSPVVFPGLYWEEMFGHLGLGMTYLGKFKRLENSENGYDWQFDWIGSLDLRYHFITESLLDPFVEFGLGCAGRVEFPVHSDQAGHESYNGEPLLLSIFFQAGGGIAFRFDSLHAGLRVLYRIMNDPVPGTVYDVYPLYRLESVFFAGVSF
jgi:hypothetical protein